MWLKINWSKPLTEPLPIKSIDAEELLKVIWSIFIAVGLLALFYKNKEQEIKL